MPGMIRTFMAHGRVAAEAGCGLAEQDARAGPLNRAPVANGRAVSHYLAAALRAA
ncbi:hypothetical protein CHLRE_13g577026v5 [Chlamydomonas reinhardtii]|uniref:Uncharacterized protein n=1 Tax=Chlamydomonas reinhardtii TaxID=3055 RepID=A0A2K3D030_CHLRE|nr:uncharacterized protein CHLRE_13g577026v5 [Chlamydomonas reinhardtii]PNW73892.1 hypothetical protein CHLRE_13g577026v5 [Chlamydomonas reinhardtii]